VALLFGAGIAAIFWLRASGFDPNWLNYVNIAFWYFGITIGASAFPSDSDTRGAYEYTRQIKFRIIHYVFAILNALRVLWADYLYGFFIALIPSMIITSAVPDIKAYNQSQSIVKVVLEFKHSIEQDKTLEYKDDEVINLTWQKIDKNTNGNIDVLNPFGGNYVATALVYNTDVKRATIIISTDRIPKPVCEHLLKKEIVGIDGTVNKLPLLVQTKEEVDANTPPTCKDDNMILFPFNRTVE
jgi:hypothetical protein